MLGTGDPSTHAKEPGKTQMWVREADSVMMNECFTSASRSEWEVFSAFMHCTLLSKFAGSFVPLRKVIEPSSCNGSYTSSSRSAQIRLQKSFSGQLGHTMFNPVGQQLVLHSGHQRRSAHVRHPEVGDQSGSIARTAL